MGCPPVEMPLRGISKTPNSPLNRSRGDIKKVRKYKGLGLTGVIKYDNLDIKYDNCRGCHGGDFMANIDEQANTKVIPLPKERECLAILGEDGEVTGYLSKTRKNILGCIGWLLFRTDLHGWHNKA